MLPEDWRSRFTKHTFLSQTDSYYIFKPAWFQKDAMAFPCLIHPPITWHQPVAPHTSSRAGRDVSKETPSHPLM